MSSLLSQLSYTPVELNFGTSGLRGLVSDMTDLECYINTVGFIDFLADTKDVKLGAQIALAGDLRPSTPRILMAVAKAIIDSGYQIAYLGEIPIPAAAYYGFSQGMPVTMVTGSHIPDDRNGIKFYRVKAEVLKPDESAIKDAVAKARQEIYAEPYEKSIFDNRGFMREAPKLPAVQTAAAQKYLERYTSLFEHDALSGKTIIVYQHSSLAADMLVKLLESFGANVIPVDRSAKFVPIDTENVTDDNQRYFRSLAKKFPNCFAIISADGDSDRPFVVDESGFFHRGDVLGALTAAFLKAKSAAVPVSTNDSVDEYLETAGIRLLHTKIGSPYVIAGMQELATEKLEPTVGWEVNGGFLTGSDIHLGKGLLRALPTRDAFLPIVCVLMSAAEQNLKLSDTFNSLPPRFTQAGLIDNFPVDTSGKILARHSADSQNSKDKLSKFFTAKNGFGEIVNINSLDGIRILFSNKDIVHIRPSGNAPQLRVYSVADSQARADEIVEMSIRRNGILFSLASSV